MTESVLSMHAPVLLDEAVAALVIRSDGVYVDATYGRGGHSREILGMLGEQGRLFVVDRDPQAIESARQELGADLRVQICHATFDRLADFVSAGTVDGILFDLGVSSPQLDDPSRGFSFLRDGPLDMRMDPTTGVSAADYLAHAREQEIAAMISQFSEDRFARRIAHAITAARLVAPILTTSQLAEIVTSAIPARFREVGKHPATRTFQALRIKVNRELELLECALESALELLAVNGRLAVISFHSLEDRPVKRFMRRFAEGDPVWRGMPNIPIDAQPYLQIIGKATRPSDQEVGRNTRARSAVLRVAQKVRS